MYKSTFSPIIKICRSFLRSRSQPKLRKNLRSRYANMMENIHPRSDCQTTSDCGSFSTRRPRITTPSSLTDPTTIYRDSGHGRLGAEFSILKPAVSKVSHACFPKILALPSWLQDTITELDVSHPLRTVFPTLHDVSDPSAIKEPPEDPTQYPPGRGANLHFFLPTTPPRSSGARPQDSDTSSDEPQASSAHHSLYQNDSLLHLRSGPSIPPLSDLLQQETASIAASNHYPNSTLTKCPHICGSETNHPPASSSVRNPDDHLVSPATQQDAEYGDVFRYDPSHVYSGTVLPPFKPFVFEKPIRVYFDSPTEDPIDNDLLEPSDFDPFKLDPEEYRKISFKWVPFDLRTGTKRGLKSSEIETSPKPPGIGEAVAD